MMDSKMRWLKKLRWLKMIAAEAARAALVIACVTTAATAMLGVGAGAAADACVRAD